MKHRHLALLLLLGILLGLVSLVITLYPLLGNYLSEKNKSTVLTEYARTVDSMEDESILGMLADAQAYNDSLKPGAVFRENAFSHAGQGLAGENYRSLLAVSADGVMGYIEIPKICVYLPIYHGTDAGIGHLIGSSLPVGGESTHAVLTGHSGMAREKMFSDLDQLRAGDLFYLHVLGNTLAYEVDQTKIVLPDNTDYLGIEKGEDLCTLVTCTPFGVNTHRLLVRGHRVAYEESAGEPVPDSEDGTEPAASTWQRHYVKGLAAAAAILAAAAVLSGFTIFRRRGKHEAGPSQREARKRR